MADYNGDLSRLKKEVAEKIHSLDGFKFEKSGFILLHPRRNNRLLHGLCANKPTSNTPDKVAEYVKDLLLQCNRCWGSLEREGETAYWQMVASSAFNCKGISLLEDEVRDFALALIRARERHLVRSAANAPQPSLYAVPNNMLEAAAQRLLSRIEDAKKRMKPLRAAFMGVPMTENEKRFERAKVKQMGPASTGNSKKYKLSEKCAQKVYPIGELSRAAPKQDWFGFIDSVASPTMGEPSNCTAKATTGARIASKATGAKAVAASIAERLASKTTKARSSPVSSAERSAFKPTIGLKSAPKSTAQRAPTKTTSTRSAPVPTAARPTLKSAGVRPAPMSIAQRVAPKSAGNKAASTPRVEKFSHKSISVRGVAKSINNERHTPKTPTSRPVPKSRLEPSSPLQGHRMRVDSARVTKKTRPGSSSTSQRASVVTSAKLRATMSKPGRGNIWGRPREQKTRS